VDLEQWIASDHASVLTRFDNAIGTRVPINRWKDGGVSGEGGPMPSIAWLLFHTTFHQDLALNTGIRNHAPLLHEHRDALGLSAMSAWAGLSESEDRSVTDALDLALLHQYVREVNAATAAWIDHISLLALDSVPNNSWRLEHHAGIPAEGEMSWLHTMWTDMPVSWLVQWECIGHGHAHVGEMTGIRNRLGFSPF
jgi:hypothetical protein